MHAAWERAHRDVLHRAYFPAFDDDVREWLRLAEERIALLLLAVRQRLFLIRPVIHDAVEELALARAARAVATAVGDDETFPQGAFQYGFVARRLETVVARFDGDA